MLNEVNTWDAVMDNLGLPLVHGVCSPLQQVNMKILPQNRQFIRTFTDQKIPAARGDRRTSNSPRHYSQPLQVAGLKHLTRQMQPPGKYPDENMRSNFRSLLHDREVCSPIHRKDGLGE